MSALATASITCGIIGLFGVLLWLPTLWFGLMAMLLFFLALIGLAASAIAVVMGHVVLARRDPADRTARVQAIVGLSTGYPAVAVVVSLLGWFAISIFGVAAG